MNKNDVETGLAGLIVGLMLAPLLGKEDLFSLLGKKAPEKIQGEEKELRINFAIAPSATTPGKVYRLFTTDGRTVQCECPSYTYRQTCRHIKGKVVPVHITRFFDNVKPLVPEPEPVKEAVVEKRLVPVQRVRSATSRKYYNVSMNLDTGQLECSCIGFFHRGKCRHVDYVKEYSKNAVVC